MAQQSFTIVITGTIEVPDGQDVKNVLADVARDAFVQVDEPSEDLVDVVTRNVDVDSYINAS